MSDTPQVSELQRRPGPACTQCGETLRNPEQPWNISLCLEVPKGETTITVADLARATKPAPMNRTPYRFCSKLCLRGWIDDGQLEDA